MAKKKPAGKFSEGVLVRVKEGVPSPEFPDISLAGWTGTIVETSGKAAPLQCVIEWDQGTLARMPAEYQARCETQGLYHLMACLSEETLDVA